MKPPSPRAREATAHARQPPGIEAVREAAKRIRPFAHVTPVLTSSALDGLSEASVFFKCENFQKAGAFKFRGALNAVFSLDEDVVVRGVATHSSGNHAAALSLAARLCDARATVVMPENSSAAKRAAVAHYGGHIVVCGTTQKSREDTLARVVTETGATPVPPFDDYRVIAGQGTAALELLEQAPGLDALLAPVGGGGLLAGSAIATAALSPETKVFGGEPEAVDDTWRSLRAGRRLPVESADTIADGLRTSVGALTFPIIQAKVEDVIRVSEDEIRNAMRLVLERMKILIEPSSAVPVAALLKSADRFRGRRVGVILSGGNVDLDALPWRASTQ